MSGMKAAQLRNRINAFNGNWDISLKNIKVNSETRGCSGFITNLDTGVIVYVDTEPSVYSPLSNKVLYRTAESTNDFSGKGGQNRWGLRHNEQFISEIVSLTRG